MENTKTIVVKFGGSILTSPKDITLAAEKIAKEVEKGTKIVVVVSALAGVTDNLLKTAYEISQNNLGKPELDEVLSMGERTATRLMVSALKSLGLKTVGLDPADEKFVPLLSIRLFIALTLWYIRIPYVVQSTIVLL